MLAFRASSGQLVRSFRIRGLNVVFPSEIDVIALPDGTRLEKTEDSGEYIVDASSMAPHGRRSFVHVEWPAPDMVPSGDVTVDFSGSTRPHVVQRVPTWVQDWVAEVSETGPYALAPAIVSLVRVENRSIEFAVELDLAGILAIHYLARSLNILATTGRFLAGEGSERYPSSTLRSTS
jgi:hypothetical protein